MSIQDTARLDSLLEQLRERADLLTDENYHSEASKIDQLVRVVEINRHRGAELCLFKVLEEATNFGDL